MKSGLDVLAITTLVIASILGLTALVYTMTLEPCVIPIYLGLSTVFWASYRVAGIR